MDTLLSSIIQRPRMVFSTFIFLLVLGFGAYTNIPKEADPDVVTPIVNVRIALEGVSPADAERLLVRPLEEQFADLDGLKKIIAKSFQGGAMFTLEFEPTVDIDQATQDVRVETDEARPEMPSDIEEPQITEVNPVLFPVVVLALFGDVPERLLQQHARALRDQLINIPDVAQVNISGAREEVVEIVVNPARLQSYGLSSDDLSRVFNRANRLVAAGRLDTGQGSFSVTVPGLFEGIDDIYNMPVKASDDAVVRLKDIADIRRTYKDADTYVRVNGERAVSIDVMKRSAANVIRVSEAANRLAEQYRPQLPKSIVLSLPQDQAIQIRVQVNTLQNNVILAVFLVMALVLATLGVRSGLLVGLAIPVSFLIGIFVLYVLEVTVSIVVMFGMIIAVGMLVDGGIIIVEYADRKMNEGLHRRDAYIMAAQRMAWPIISSTATTIAAFLPLLFWPGVVGQVLSYMPITLICVLVASLFVALIFIPSFGAVFGQKSDQQNSDAHIISGSVPFDRNALSGVTRRYIMWLDWALTYPGRILAGIVVLLIAVLMLYSVAGNGILFFPTQEDRRAVLLVHGLGNLSVDEKDKLIREIEFGIINDASFADLKALYARAGVVSGDVDADIIGSLTLEFHPWENRRWAREIFADVGAIAAEVPGIWTEFETMGATPIVGKPIQLEVSSNHPDTLMPSLLHIRRGMDEIQGFTNIDDSRPLPGIEWRLQVDRAEAARFGADLTSIGDTVRLVTNGVKLGAYRPDDSEDELDIRVRFPVQYRSMNQLDEIRIQTNMGLVPLSNFVRRAAIAQEQEYTRVNRKRVMTIGAETVEGINPPDKVTELKAWLEKHPLDPRVQLTFRGEQEAQEQSGSFLIVAFAVAMFLMGAILLIQFNSFYSVLLILSSVILSTIGVLLGYIITGQPFVIVMSGLGLIALAGIVVNNNIVLIDTYDRLVKTASSKRDAILQTGAQRLRPVFLTTSTTALGLVPMSIMLSVDFFNREVSLGAPATMWWQPLAVTIIFGLLFSTVLTLLITPAALMLRVNLAAKREKKRLR